MLHRKNRGRDWQVKQFGRSMFGESYNTYSQRMDRVEDLMDSLASLEQWYNDRDMFKPRSENPADTDALYGLLDIWIQTMAEINGAIGSLKAKQSMMSDAQMVRLSGLISEQNDIQQMIDELDSLAGRLSQFSKRGRGQRHFKRASFRRRIFQSTQKILDDLGMYYHSSSSSIQDEDWNDTMEDLSSLIHFAGNGVLKQIFSAMDKILYENPGFNVPGDVQDKRIELGFNAMRPGRTGLMGAVSQIGKGALRVTDDIANDMFLVPGWRRGEKRPVYGRNRRSRRNRGRW